MNTLYRSRSVASSLLSFCCIASLIGLPSVSRSQLVNGRFISSVYSWEKFDSVGVSRRYTRGFQSVLLDIAQSDFSIHTHVQGAMALQKNLDETPDLRVWYLYAKLKNIASSVDISLGRLPYFAGVGSGTLDGALTSFHSSDNMYRFTLYGGANVPVGLGFDDWKPLKKDFTVGGQVLISSIPNTRLGISYVNRQRARDPYWSTRADSLFNPSPFYVVPAALKEQYISGDISYRFTELRLYGRYDHDLNEEKIQRAQGGIRYDVDETWTLTADYIHREPRVPFNSFFALFSGGRTEELEAGADYMLYPELRLFARAGQVNYEGDASARWTAGIAHDYISLTYRGSDGYAGELTSLTADAAYPLLENAITPSCGVSFSSYRLDSSSEREEALALAVGSTVRPVSQLSVDLQGQWVNNKVSKSDFRFFGKLNFWFSNQLNIFH